MSTRFYYGQLDYIEQLNNMDDVATASATSAAASAAAAAQSAQDAEDAAQTLTVPLANIKYIYNDYSVATGVFVPITLPTIGQVLLTGHAYRIELITLGTSSTTGAVYIAYPTAAGVWSLVNTSRVAGTTVNPLLRISLDGTKLEIYHSSGSTFTIRASVKSMDLGQNVVGTTIFGLEGLFSSIDGVPAYNGSQIWTVSSLTNVSQLTNDSGYTTAAAANAYADSLVVSMWDDRGNYDASVNTFPTTGGSGSAGAVKKNDIWTISVAGTLGGTPVAVRQFIRALVDTPGQTATNWAIGLANTDIDDSITDGVIGRAPSQNAVFDALAGKQATLGFTPVQQGTGIGQGSNTVKIGWGSSGSGLKVTVDTTDQGYIPFSSTNPGVSGITLAPTIIANGGLIVFSSTSIENLTFSGVGRRIMADMSNTTQSNRLAFQTNATNQSTTLGIIPNGTSTISALAAHEASDMANSGRLLVGTDGTTCFIRADQVGTGTYRPLTVSTGGLERIRFLASSNVTQIKTTDADNNNRFAFQDVAGNPTSLDLIPGGTNSISQFVAWGGPGGSAVDRNNTSWAAIVCSNTMATISTGATGTGAQLPMSFVVNGAEHVRIDLGGDVLFGTTTSGNPVTQRVNGTVISKGTKAIYSRCSSEWVMGINTTSGVNISFHTDNGSTAVSAGSISSNGSTTAYNTSSDYRLKYGLKPMIGALNSIMQIEFMTWNWKYDGRPGEGVVAHKLNSIDNPIEDAVHGDKDGIDDDGNILPQQVDYSKLVPRIGCAVQELSTLLEQALARIVVLENQGA